MMGRRRNPQPSSGVRLMRRGTRTVAVAVSGRLLDPSLCRLWDGSRCILGLRWHHRLPRTLPGILPDPQHAAAGGAIIL